MDACFYWGGGLAIMKVFIHNPLAQIRTGAFAPLLGRTLMSNIGRLASLTQKRRTLTEQIGAFPPWRHGEPEVKALKVQRCRVADEIQVLEQRTKVH